MTNNQLGHHILMMDTNLRSMHFLQVRENVKTAMEMEQGLAHIDEALLQQVEQILQPVKNITWPSGRPENN
jgi:hypothetical protein